MKKAAIGFLCLTLCFVFAFSAFAQTPQTAFQTAADLLAFVMVGKTFTTPLRIVPAVLTVRVQNAAINVGAMLGMKNVEGQVNSAKGGGTTAYAALVKKVLFETVPAGSALVFAGHSLGGMTAQLLRCDEELQEAYELLNVLCGGSPLMEESRTPEGTLHRLTDTFDMIPYIAGSSLCNFLRQIRTAHRENGGYFLNPDGAHNLSYARNDVWGSYDVFGEKGGNASLQFQPKEIRAFGDAGSN